jgi:hypothetical protein
MPRTTPSLPDYLGLHLGNQAALVAAQAQRQTTTIVDSSQATTTDGVTTPGPVVAYLGQVPSGMPTSNPRWRTAAHPIYGLQMMNTATGNPVMHVGSQPDATHGMWSLDDDGNVVLKVGEIVDSSVFAGTLYGEALYNSSGELIGLFGQLPGGDYGVAIYDTAGNLRAQLGELPSGDYGLLVKNTDGSQQEILPAVFQYAGGPFNTASTTPVTKSGSPSKTAILGQSANALITVSCNLLSSVHNDSANVDLCIDGTDVGTFLSLSGDADNLNMPVSYVTPLDTFTTSTPGSHTFSLKYWTSNAASTMTATVVTLIVQPI